MSFTDPIGDLLTRMRNAQHGRHTDCHIPWSRMKESICMLLKEHGYLAEVLTEGEIPQKEVVVTFRSDREPLTLKRVSTPGGRKYVASADLRTYLHGAATAVISTSGGLMTDKEAREKNMGGEYLCTVS